MPEPMKDRVFREHDAYWEAAKARAEREGTTISRELRAFIRRYGRKTQ